jgi:hypothetical protein
MKLLDSWVTCPRCHAGSPAGISVCPRCRYLFQLRPAVLAAEYSPVIPSERPPRHRTVSQMTLLGPLLAMMALSIPMTWPKLLLPVLAACLTMASTAGLFLLLRRLGLGLLGIFVITAIIGLILGFVLPPVISY